MGKTVVLVDISLTSRTSSAFRTRIGRENIGAQLVAACCQNFSGWKVRYLQPDSNNPNVIHDAITKGSYDALVFFPYTHTKWLADQVAQLFKGKIPIIYGGHHTIGTSALKVFEEGIADYVISGRGDRELPRLLQELETKGTPPQIIYAGKTEAPSNLYPLDSLPWPIRRENLIQDLTKEPLPLKPPSDLEPNPQKCIVIAGSIGCKGRCDFCSSWKISPKPLHRSPQNIVEEMSWLRNQYGPRLIYHFADPLFNANRDWVMKLCHEMTEQGPFPSICMPDFNLDEEMVWAMKRAGIYKAMMGLEFTSDDSRTARGKRPGEVSKAFRLCNEAGILTRAFFMIGRLGMTREDLNAEIDALETADFRADELRIGFEVPFPGTEISDRINPDDTIVGYPYWTADEIVYRTGLSSTEWEKERLRMLCTYHFCRKQGEYYKRQISRFPVLEEVYSDFLGRLDSAIKSSQYS